MIKPIQFIKKHINLNRAIELSLIAITAFAVLQTAIISERLANQDLKRLQAELRPYLTIKLYPEPNIFGTKEHFKRDGNSNYFWDGLHEGKYLILPFKIQNVGKLPAINIKAKYNSPSQTVWFKIGENSISPDSETGEFFHPWINISSLINDERIKRFEIYILITYKGNDEVDSRTYVSQLKMKILKENKNKYLVENSDFRFDVDKEGSKNGPRDRLGGMSLTRAQAPSITNYKRNNEHFVSGLPFNTLLTIYSIYLVFVIFCFQEINNKIRHAHDKFRAWCRGRRDKVFKVKVKENGKSIEKELNTLQVLDINWEFDAWLEKDLIFHIYNLKLKIKEAKDKIETGNRTIADALKEIHENACNDYYDYIYQCFLFKNRSKWLAIILFIFLVVIYFHPRFFPLYPLTSCIYIGIIIFAAIVMLAGPKFNFTNNPLSQRFNSLEDIDKKQIERLKRLVKEI